MVMRDPLLTSSAVNTKIQGSQFSIIKLSSIETRHIVHVHQKFWNYKIQKAKIYCTCKHERN